VRDVVNESDIVIRDSKLKTVFGIHSQGQLLDELKPWYRIMIKISYYIVLLPSVGPAVDIKSEHVWLVRYATNVLGSQSASTGIPSLPSIKENHQRNMRPLNTKGLENTSSGHMEFLYGKLSSVG